MGDTKMSKAAGGVRRATALAAVAAAVLVAGGRAGAAGPDEGAELPVVSSPYPSVQWTLTLANGGGILGGGSWNVAEGVYHLGAHMDVFIKRKGPGAWAGGIAMAVGGLDVRYLLAGAGMSVLMPISETFPLILEILPAYMRGKRKDSLAVGGRLWWGIHDFNYHAGEVAVAGIYMMMHRAVLGGDEGRWMVVWGLDLSLHVLAVPFGMAWQAMVRK